MSDLFATILSYPLDFINSSKFIFYTDYFSFRYLKLYVYLVRSDVDLEYNLHMSDCFVHNVCFRWNSDLYKFYEFKNTYENQYIQDEQFLDEFLLYCCNKKDYGLR